MKPKLILTPLLCTAPVLLALTLPGDKLAFQPEDASSVSKTLNLSMEFTVDELYVNMMGQEITPEMMGASADDLTLTGQALVAVSEQYIKSSGGKPVELLRTFDELSLEMVGGGESTDVEEFAELQGETVEFKWDKDSEEYKITFHESEGDEELIQDLSADMDLRALLPEDEVDKDDTWDVDVKSLDTVFFPGGMVGSTMGDEEQEISEMIEEAIMQQFEAMQEEFTLTCRYKGNRSVDDVAVGEIAFEFEGEGTLDLSEIITTLIESQEGGPESPDIVADLTMGLKGEGNLLWNLAEGHVHSFDMSAEVELAADVEVSASMQGQEIEASLSAEVSGQVTWDLDTE